MTHKELTERVRVEWAGYGQYVVRIKFRGKEYKCHSNNSPAWDSRNYDRSDGDSWSGYTAKQALQAFWDECCRKNRIGKYKE